MHKIKLLKLILIPTLGISAIGTIPVVSTSCSCGSENPEIIRVTSVSLNKTSTTLAVDNNETLNATVLPENATDKTVTWGSSDTSVAAVDANGKITAVGLGNATITVTTNDGGLTATCEVNVNSPYVIIIANANSALTLNNKDANIPDLQYSTDDGASWITYSKEINIGQGQTLYLKGNNPDGWSKSNTNYSYLSITGDVSISGNVMGLLDNGAAPGEEGDITTIPCDYCFIGLFEGSAGITSISEDFLPAMTLTNKCYQYMFSGCTSLTTAPELPATSLADSCYWAMFHYCTSLIEAPELPATNLVEDCYGNMFSGCSSLTVAPELPATSLAKDCYQVMFFGCTSLTTAPELPATTLTNGCYAYMFSGCSSLNSIWIDYIGNYDSTYFDHWVDNVSGHGTFYYDGGQTAQNFQLLALWVTTGHNFLVIDANTNSTLTLNNGGENNPNLQYSTDRTNWSVYNTTIDIPQGLKIYLKGNNPTGWSHSTSSFSTIYILGNISISGNVMALLDNGAKSGEEGDITDIPCDYCFYDLFRDSTGITSVTHRFLPATSMTYLCYSEMFSNCTSLTIPPKLPATTLSELCYNGMFHNCSSLITAPELPATTLATECYSSMFDGCSSLNSIKIGYTGNYNWAFFMNWVNGVASSGTFYYNGGDTLTNFGFLSSWTKQPF